MNKKSGRLIIIIPVVALCLAGSLAAAYAGLVATAEKAAREYKNMTPVDLTAIADGVYNGKAGQFICSVDLNVLVRDHKITDITVNHQVNGGGKYAATDLYPRIISQQSCNVDVVSGATLTSETVLVAVNRALSSKPQ